MDSRLAPHGLARAGFVLLASVLAVFALPPLRGSALLLPALVAVGVGFAFIAFKRDAPPLSRAAGGAFGAYVVILLLLLVVATPFTLGKHGSVASGEPPAWAAPVFFEALSALPAALVLGVAVTAWPWSNNAGRATILASVVLLVLFLALDWLATPTGFDTVSGAEAFGRAAAAAMSLAAVALLAGVVLLLRGPRDAATPKA